MSVMVHLSDTHFGTEVAPVLQAAERAVREIKPDIVTISGDITQRAHPSQFQAASDFLAVLHAEIRFVIPGNHDIPLFNIPLRMANPYRDYKKIFGAREGFWVHNDIGIMGFDATSRWRHTRGYIPNDTLACRLKEARAQLKPGALLIACAHQPLAVALPIDQENVLIHAQRTAELFAEYQVDLVLSGHVHMPLIATTQQIFPAIAHPFVLSGAGTAVSYRIRSGAPNSFNVIRTGAETISITLMEYHQASGQFAAALEKKFTLTPTGWRI